MSQFEYVAVLISIIVGGDGAKNDDTIVFGWVVFESREARDLANERVAVDPRMTDLIDPLTHSSRPIFDAKRMVYGGFQSLVQLSNLNAG